MAIHEIQPKQGLVTHTTAITLAEVFYGIARLPVGARRASLNQAGAEVFASFEHRILVFDSRAGLEYSRIVTERDFVGSPINGFDAQIAAICSVHQATLATRNTKDFRDTGIDLVNPWGKN